MGIQKVDTLKVRQFWEWFSKNCRNFGVDFDNVELLERLDRWVTQLGDFSWELGPGKSKDNALVISPGGDVELLEDTKLIVGVSTACEGWEYYYAIPPKGKEWDLIFSLETGEGEIVEVDASQWQYTLLKFEDGMFEIILKVSDLQLLDKSDRQSAAEILLDGVLGEELRIQTFCGIDTVDDFEEVYKNKAGNIKNLPNHLNQLVKK